jgi:predicted metal-dependent phosphoesterase TrpH
VAAQGERRDARARAIADRLDALGHPGAWEAARGHAGGTSIGRPHFARFLVESGRVRDAEQAFDRYLGEGKPAWCRIEWPAMDEAVAWIRAAGGQAVLAHPLAYELGRRKLRDLLGSFRDCGGAAAEVALAGMPDGQLNAIARLVRDTGLRASAGSDFHARAQFWRRPSRIPPLPDYLEPVWAEWL